MSIKTNSLIWDSYDFSFLFQIDDLLGKNKDGTMEMRGYLRLFKSIAISNYNCSYNIFLTYLQVATKIINAFALLKCFMRQKKQKFFNY